ncbi:MAG: hypothetical protein V9E83_03395 [Baekduia sp.]
MRRHVALFVALVLCALFGASAVAEAAPSGLSGAKPGRTVSIGHGVTVTPSVAARRAGDGWTVERATVRIGRSVRGERVRVQLAGDGSVTLRGGSFTIPEELTAGRFTAAGSGLRITADGTEGSLEKLPGGRRKDGTAVPDVGPALPAAPAGQEWNLSLDLYDGGVRVRLLLGSDEVGSVLIRLDGSYRVALTLRDVDLFGNRVTIAGEVSGSSILDLSTIRLKGSVTGTITLAPGVELRDATLIWDRNGFTIAATVAVACPEGGELVARARLGLGNDLQNLTVDVALRAGAQGCGLAPDLKLEPGTELTATIAVENGKPSLAVDGTVKLRTSLIPPKESLFVVGIKLRADETKLEIGLSAKGDGVSFSGTINGNGTFLIEFELTDLDIAGTKLSAAGRIVRTTPDGEIRVTVNGGSSEAIWLVPGVLGITNVDLAWDPAAGRITLAATLRLVCSTGSLDLGASGYVTGTGEIKLDIAGDADNCMIGDALTLDGKTLAGTIAIDANGKPTIDLAIQLSKIALGDLSNPPPDGLVAAASNISARIRNTCALCRDGAALEISFSGEFELAGRTPPLPFLRIGVTISGGVLLEGDTLRGLAIRLTNLKLFGAPSSMTIIIEGELIRTLEAALGLPPGTIQLIPVEPVPTLPVEGESTGGQVVAVATTIDRCLAGRACRPRALVTVRTTGRGAVSVALERRSCSGGRCRWRRLTRTTLTPDARFVARARASRQLAAGTYRVVASPAARKGTTRRSEFRVLAAAR